MSVRNCPNCHSRLGNYDHYFCSVCGKILPKELENPHVDVKVRTYDVNSSMKPGKIPFRINLHFLGAFNSRVVLAILFVIAFAMLLLQLENLLYIAGIFKKVPEQPSAPVVKETSITPMQEVDLPLPIPSQTLTANDLNNYVPASADLYIYGSNLGSLLSEVFETGLYSRLFSEYPDVLAKPFVLFSIKQPDGRDEWGLVVMYGESRQVNELLTESLQGFAKFKFDGNYAVIASSEVIIESSLDAKGGKELNMNLNPHYVSMQSRLPKEGLATIIFLNENGRQAFAGSKQYKIGNTLKNTIDAVLKKGYNELVIK